LVGGSSNNSGAAGIGGLGIYSNYLGASQINSGFAFNINSNGNIGIGTTNPQYKLDVNGNCRVTSSTSNTNPSVIITKDPGNYSTFFSTWQHQAQLQVQNSNAASIVLGMSTDGLGIIQGSQSGVGYNNICLNPYWTSVTPANVGIGTFTPGYKLDVNGNINASGAIYSGGSSTGLVLQGTGTDAYVRTLNGAGTLYLGYGSTNSVAINSSGLNLSSNLLMNNATEIFAKNASGVQEVFLYPRWTDNASYLNYGSAGFYIRNNSGVSTMFMNNSGTVVVGANLQMYTSGVDSVILNNNTGRLYLNSGGTNGVEVGGAGVGIMGGPSTPYALNVNGSVNASSYNAGSDYRIKDNVLQLDETFSVDNLKPVSYYNKNLKKKDIGLIAHELQEVYPELVTGEKDGEEMQSVNYTGLIPILIKEIQDLKARVKELELKNII
jgi:hypothetical protein